MTARVNQGAVLVGLQGIGNPRVNQAAVIAAVSFASPARINQAAVMLATRAYPVRVYAPIDAATILSFCVCCTASPPFERNV